VYFAYADRLGSLRTTSYSVHCCCIPRDDPLVVEKPLLQ
jgi:hypothetical protein